MHIHDLNLRKDPKIFEGRSETNAMHAWIAAVLSLLLAAEVGGAGVLPLGAGQRLGSDVSVPPRSLLETHQPLRHFHLGLRGGSAPAADVQEVGKQFVGYYYQTFDSNRAGLAPLYQEVTFRRPPPRPEERV